MGHHEVGLWNVMDSQRLDVGNLSNQNGSDKIYIEEVQEDGFASRTGE